MAQFPTIEEVLGQLAKFAEVESLQPDAPIADLDIESLDLLEWVYHIADEYELEIDETIFDGGVELTLRDVYQRVRDRYGLAV